MGGAERPAGRRFAVSRTSSSSSSRYWATRLSASSAFVYSMFSVMVVLSSWVHARWCSSTLYRCFLDGGLGRLSPGLVFGSEVSLEVFRLVARCSGEFVAWHRPVAISSAWVNVLAMARIAVAGPGSSSWKQGNPVDRVLTAVCRCSLHLVLRTELAAQVFRAARLKMPGREQRR